MRFFILVCSMVGAANICSVPGAVTAQSWVTPDTTSTFQSPGGGDFRLRLTKSKDGRSKFVLENAASFVFALEQAPPKREEMLDKDSWLIIVVDFVSVPDVVACQAAVSALSKTLAKRVLVKVGIRPCVNQEEMKAWYPEYKNNPITPLWLVFREGTTIGSERGTWVDKKGKFDADKFTRWLGEQLSRKEKTKKRDTMKRQVPCLWLCTGMDGLRARVGALAIVGKS